jgi:hypothetical protein
LLARTSPVIFVPIDSTVPSLVSAEAAPINLSPFRDFWDETKSGRGLIFQIFKVGATKSSAVMIKRSHLKFLNHGIARDHLHTGISTM